jgi:aryl-alcohol dehydrogenase-like predicted oxidoreductase
MERRNLGGSGLIVSAVGLGCNNFGGKIDAAQSKAVVHKALDLGVTMFDTADVYGSHFGGPGARIGASEEYLGKALGEKRKDIVLCSKFGLALDKEETKKGASRRYIMNAVEDSLRRLGTDWIDLYQIHRPDPLTPIEETLRALDDLVRHGKVRYVGCSGFAAWRLVEAEWVSRYFGLNHFIVSEDEYSLLAREIERDIIPAMKAYDIGLIPFSPLASGLLTGKYQRNAPAPGGSRFAAVAAMGERFGTESNWDKVTKLEAFAAARGHTLLDLAMSWLACRPPVGSVIAGATNPEQVAQNVAAAGWKLTAEDMAEIDGICPPGVGGVTPRL